MTEPRMKSEVLDNGAEHYTYAHDGVTVTLHFVEEDNPNQVVAIMVDDQQLNLTQKQLAVLHAAAGWSGL